MSPRIHNGWLVVPYGSSDFAQVFMAVGRHRPHEWYPAYLDYLDGVRVAKIRPPQLGSGQETTVWLKVDDVVHDVGKVVL